MSDQSGTGGAPPSEPNEAEQLKQEQPDKLEPGQGVPSRLERMGMVGPGGMSGPPEVVVVAESNMIYHEREAPDEDAPEEPPPEEEVPPEEDTQSGGRY